MRNAPHTETAREPSRQLEHFKNKKRKGAEPDLEQADRSGADLAENG
jgi:hypothetical protein